MKNYEKPLLEETKIVIEGVFAGSGTGEEEKNEQFGDNCTRPNGKFKPHSNHCTGCINNMNNAYCKAGHSFN